MELQTEKLHNEHDQLNELSTSVDGRTENTEGNVGI